MTENKLYRACLCTTYAQNALKIRPICAQDVTTMRQKLRQKSAENAPKCANMRICAKMRLKFTKNMPQKRKNAPKNANMHLCCQFNQRAAIWFR